MALIQCPECGGKLSDQAKICVHCGYPLAEIAQREKTKLFKTPGSLVTFGSYPQTTEGTDKTAIEWLVLDYDSKNNKVFLLSRRGLDVKLYNDVETNVTWETCTLRTWLNKNFLKNAFSSKEQAAILLVEVDNYYNNQNDDDDDDIVVTGGDNTFDKIFLLSLAEAENYLNVSYDQNMKSRVAPTPYAIKMSAKTDADLPYGTTIKTADGCASGSWWLRTPGILQNYAACVDLDGSICSHYVSYRYGGEYAGGDCVRPALWLSLDSELFYQEN